MIETALIRQNAQTPTGVVMTILTNGERGKIAVSDVMEVQQLFREKGIDYLVDDVPKDNYLMTIILPIAEQVSLLAQCGRKKDQRHHKQDQSHSTKLLVLFQLAASLLKFYNADIRKIPVFLVIIQAKAHHKLVGDLKAGIIHLHLLLHTALRLIQQRTQMNGLRVPLL